MKWKFWVVFLAFAAFSAFLLLEEHRAHLFTALLYLILLACPLMHIFMHDGHGGHHHGKEGDDREDRQ